MHFLVENVKLNQRHLRLSSLAGVDIEQIMLQKIGFLLYLISNLSNCFNVIKWQGTGCSNQVLMKVPPSVCVDSVLDTELDREISAIVEQQPAPAAPPPPVLTRPRPIRHPGTSSSSPDQVMVAVVSTQQHSFQPGGTLPFHWIMEKVK